MTRLFNDKSGCIYTKCYCEENVWFLCDAARKADPAGKHLQDCHVVFISNDDRTVPLFNQLACISSEPHKQAVVWDYHVILIHSSTPAAAAGGGGGEVSHQVYDLDSLLPFPSPFLRYSQGTFGGVVWETLQLPHRYHRYFRVVPGAEYLSNFASDRSHMIKPRADHNGDDTWTTSEPEYYAPPPPYSHITTSSCVNNLQSYISMTRGGPEPSVGAAPVGGPGSGPGSGGRVYNYQQFVARFSPPPAAALTARGQEPAQLS